MTNSPFVSPENVRYTLDESNWHRLFSRVMEQVDEGNIAREDGIAMMREARESSNPTQIWALVERSDPPVSLH